MRVLSFRKSTMLKIILLFVFILVITRVTISFGMQNYYNLDFTTGLVTASSLNVRSGPRN